MPVALANENYDVRGEAGTFSAATEDAVTANKRFLPEIMAVRQDPDAKT